jgi:hypothetical protein
MCDGVSFSFQDPNLTGKDSHVVSYSALTLCVKRLMSYKKMGKWKKRLVPPSRGDFTQSVPPYRGLTSLLELEG